MTDRPIIFTAPMVLALIDGRKTQTRRLKFDKRGRLTTWGVLAVEWSIGQRDQRVWVRENHAFVGGSDPGHFLCEADWREQCAVLGLENCDARPRWTPSIHMPRRCSRLTLAVTDVRVQRLQAISEADAITEGMPMPTRLPCGAMDRDPRDDFAELWNALHGDDAWDANPWVVAITFTVHHRNIDAMEKAA